MGWAIIKLQSRLGEHRDDWDRLNQELYNEHPLFNSCFIEPLLQCFCTGYERLCIHRSIDGDIDGLLIVVKRRAGLWTLFIPSQAQIAPVLVKDASILKSLISALPGFALAFEFVNQDPLFSILFNKKIDLHVLYEPHVITINVDGKESFVDYWRNRSKNLQKNIRRYMNRIAKDGVELRLIRHEKKENVIQALIRYGDLESKGWKGKAGTAIHIGNDQGLFYSSIFNRFAEHSGAVVYELYIGDTLVASRLCVRNNTILIILKTTYDEGQAKYSLGRVLLYLLLEKELNSAEAVSVEFYTNASSDQMAWSTGQRTIKHVSLFRSDILYICYQFLQKWRNYRAKNKKQL